MKLMRTFVIATLFELMTVIVSTVSPAIAGPEEPPVCPHMKCNHP